MNDARISSGAGDNANSADNPDYRIMHRAPQPGDVAVRLDRLLDGTVFPTDVLEHPDWYGQQHLETELQLRRVLRSGDPEARVTIYRSVPAGVTRINRGDWVGVRRRGVLPARRRRGTRSALERRVAGERGLPRGAGGTRVP